MRYAHCPRRTSGVCAWLAVFVVWLAAPCSLSANDLPNILFAIADDWSWSHAGAYGDTVVQTPTFDRLCAKVCYFSMLMSRLHPAHRLAGRSSRANGTGGCARPQICGACSPTSSRRTPRSLPRPDMKPERLVRAGGPVGPRPRRGSWRDHHFRALKHFCNNGTRASRFASGSGVRILIGRTNSVRENERDWIWIAFSRFHACPMCPRAQ